MNVQEKLMSKNGIATVKLAKQLINVNVGERIPTVAEMAKSNNMAIGTTHNALKVLESENAIEIISKGHMGSFLSKKDKRLLLSFAGIEQLVGAMPLPYTKRYEGLATGLINELEVNNDIPINLAFMRGAKMRISMVLQGRYDFAIVSKFAAEEHLKTNDDIIQLLSFGANSYTSEHVIMFHDNEFSEVMDGMKIGIDNSSIDQANLTKLVCKGKKVLFVDSVYSHIVDDIITGKIDATVMNVDEVIEKSYNINYRRLDDSIGSSEAVMVFSKTNQEVAQFIKDILNPQDVIYTQKQVMNGEIQPRY